MTYGPTTCVERRVDAMGSAYGVGLGRHPGVPVFRAARVAVLEREAQPSRLFQVAQEYAAVERLSPVSAATSWADSGWFARWRTPQIRSVVAPNGRWAVPATTGQAWCAGR